MRNLNLYLTCSLYVCMRVQYKFGQIRFAFHLFPRRNISCTAISCHGKRISIKFCFKSLPLEQFLNLIGFMERYVIRI